MLTPNLNLLERLEHPLIDTPPTTQEGIRLLETIEDIANHVELRNDFSLNHSLSPAVELAEELVIGLQQLPLEQQDHYLRCRVATYLYGVYDDGELQSSGARSSLNSHSLSSHSSSELLQNRTLGIRSDFFQQLQHCNSGQGYFDPGWLIVRETADGLFAVHKDGLTMHIDRDRHLANPMVNIGDSVSVRLPNNLMDNGCYVAVSNQGPCPKNGNDQHQKIQKINLYLNLSLEGILEAMAELTTALNELHLPFSLAIPHDLESCQDRCDVGTLSIPRQAYTRIQPSLTNFYRNHTPSFRDKIPLFARVLAPGLGLSEQPWHSFIPQESFSMHQFQVLAEGLVHTWRQQQPHPQARKVAMLQALAQYQIDLNVPYLNPGSQDDYGFSL